MNLHKSLQFAVLIATVALPSAAAADRKVETVRLTVSPAKVPVPALRYRLAIDPKSRIAGNAAIDYHRAVLQFVIQQRENADFAKLDRDKLVQWIEQPIEDLPKEEARKFLAMVRLGDLERGSRRANCDWQVPFEEGFETMLTEFQEARTLARILMLRARLAIAEGRTDEALQTLAINFQLSRHLCEGRTLIGSLVGAAVASIGLVQVEYLIGQPNAPSLYWALSELPMPFVMMDSALDSESVFVDNQFPQLRTLQSRVLSKEEAKRVSDELFAMFERVGDGLGSKPKALPLVAMLNYSHAKQSLIAAGRPAAEVEAMPVEQVLWLDSYRAYVAASNDMFKWSRLPVRERAERREAPIETSAFELTSLLPAALQALNARDRTDRKFAILRVVEAVRVHAGVHGKLPESLDAIREVPVPHDPLTNAPFLYRLNGEEAAIETEATPVDTYAKHYVLRLRK